VTTLAPRTVLLTATAMVAFAANSLLCRQALGTGAIDAVSFTTLRLCAGAATLTLLARRRAGGGSWQAAAYLFAYAICFSLAYRSIGAGTGALLLFGAVQVTMLVAGLRAGERPPARTWFGFLLAVGGLVGLVAPGLSQPDPLGALLMAAAGVGWGFYSLRGRGSTSPLRANADNFARCVPFAVVASLLALLDAPPHVSATGALLAVASGALASGIGYAIWYAALPALRASQAAIVQLTVPPLAALGGVLLLGETASLRLVLAAAAILGGVALAVRARR
jgi:drug/metabolite transporter (DMT)-like permease